MTKITPITTWWMCRPPPAEMLRGCHHLRGLSLSAWLRMYRTIVRVTKNVRMNATRQHTSGSRPWGIARSRSNVTCTQKTYAAAWRDVPRIWSGAPRTADSLFCDMSIWRSPGGAGWWPTVAWRLFQLLTLAALVWAGWRLLGHTPYRIDIDVYRMGGRAWLDGKPLYADGAMFETRVRAGPAVHLSPAGGGRLRAVRPAAAVRGQRGDHGDHARAVDRVHGDRADPPGRLAATSITPSPRGCGGAGWPPRSWRPRWSTWSRSGRISTSARSTSC